MTRLTFTSAILAAAVALGGCSTPFGDGIALNGCSENLTTAGIRSLMPAACGNPFSEDYECLINGKITSPTSLSLEDFGCEKEKYENCRSPNTISSMKGFWYMDADAKDSCYFESDTYCFNECPYKGIRVMFDGNVVEIDGVVDSNKWIERMCPEEIQEDDNWLSPCSGSETTFTNSFTTNSFTCKSTDEGNWIRLPACRNGGQGSFLMFIQDDRAYIIFNHQER